MIESKFHLFCNAVSEMHPENAIILQHGEVIAREDWVPEERRCVYSISKSFMGTAAGFAIEEGILSLDEKVTDLLPDRLPARVSPELAALEVRHLLTMTVGQKNQVLMGSQRKTLKETDWIRFALRQPFAHMPGTSFLYSNTGPYLLGIILQRKTGQSVTDYLMPRLFDPLEIPRPYWEQDPEGNEFGAGGLHLNVTELTRFGQLYLQEGVWKGQQVIPKSWIRQVERTYIPTGGPRDYSMLFWRTRHDTLSAVGKYGQYVTICADKDVVFVMTAEDSEDRNLLAYFWDYVYPSL